MPDDVGVECQGKPEFYPHLVFNHPDGDILVQHSCVAVSIPFLAVLVGIHSEFQVLLLFNLLIQYLPLIQSFILKSEFKLLLQHIMSQISRQSILFNKIDFFPITTLHQLLPFMEFYVLHEVLINGLYYIGIYHLILFPLNLQLQLIKIKYFWLQSRLHCYLQLTVGLSSDSQVNMIWKEDIKVGIWCFLVDGAM